jgi:hypothetical protein
VSFVTFLSYEFASGLKLREASPSFLDKLDLKGCIV